MAGQHSEEFEELKRDRDELKEQLRQALEAVARLTAARETPAKEGVVDGKSTNADGKVENSKNNGKMHADTANDTPLGYVYYPTAPYYTRREGSYVPYENPVHYPSGTLAVGQEKPLGVIGRKEDDSVDENKRTLSLIEERLRGLEGSSSYYRLINAAELSLVDGLVIPPKFKAPEFEKFDGTKNYPNNHLKSYTRKMGPYAENEKLMIYCFQDSLTGTASAWYNQLDKDLLKKRKVKLVISARSLIHLTIHLQHTIILSIVRAQSTTIAHPCWPNLLTMLMGTMHHLMHILTIISTQDISMQLEGYHFVQGHLILSQVSLSQHSKKPQLTLREVQFP